MSPSSCQAEEKGKRVREKKLHKERKKKRRSRKMNKRVGMNPEKIFLTLSKGQQEEKGWCLLALTTVINF